MKIDPVQQAAAELLLQDIGDRLRQAMPEGYHFTLLITSTSGNVLYTSNLERKQAVKVMHDFIQNFGPKQGPIILT